MNGSGVGVKMAGTESIANTRTGDLDHHQAQQQRSSEKCRLAGLRVWQLDRERLAMHLAPDPHGLLQELHHRVVTIIFTPVAIGTTAKKYITQANCISSAAPRPIMMARSTITLRMPQNSTRFCYFRGTVKYMQCMQNM